MGRKADKADDLLALARQHFNQYQVGGRGLQRRRSTRGRGVPQYPFASTSMGGAPSQAAELRETLQRAGVPTEVNRAGDPVIRSLKHKNAVARVMRMPDRDGYYN